MPVVAVITRRNHSTMVPTTVATKDSQLLTAPGSATVVPVAAAVVAVVAAVVVVHHTVVHAGPCPLATEATGAAELVVTLASTTLAKQSRPTVERKKLPM